MQDLQKFIDQQNRMRDLFKEPPFNKVADLTDEEKKLLGQHLSSALSPESLTCDGEVRGRALQTKARWLNGAKKELEAIGGVVEPY